MRWLTWRRDAIEITKPGDKSRIYRPGRTRWYLFDFIRIPEWFAMMFEK